MSPKYPTPTFRFEENRLVYSLRLIAYPGDTFTSEESVRCAFAVTAVRRGDRTPPAHETNLDEWTRVLEVISSAEPRAWVQGDPAPLVTDERAAEATRLANAKPRSTQH